MNQTFAMPTNPDLKTISPGPVRIFSDRAIQAALDNALLGADNHSRFAVVAHADLQRFVAVAKYERGPWTIAGLLEKTWNEPGFTAGAEIRFEI